MKMTIDEIAKLAKVSRSTVSRAINDQEGINKKTRDRIIAVIEKNNYRPNAFARAISSNKTKSIGIFMPAFADLISVSSVYTDIIFGITEVVTARGYFILYFDTQDFDSIVTEKMIDGVIFLGMGRRNNRSLEDFAGFDGPVVSTGRHSSANPRAFYVDVDNFQSSRTACRHLAERGHRRIALLKNEDMGLLCSVTRQDGYLAALAESGCDVDERLIAADALSFAGGYRAMQRLLDEGGKFTACFAHHDNMALGAIKAVFERGLRVPDDISFVGFDNVPYSSYSIPALTTVDQSSFGRGKAAANLLLDIVERRSPGYSIDVPGQLVVRESVKTVTAAAGSRKGRRSGRK